MKFLDLAAVLGVGVSVALGSTFKPARPPAIPLAGKPCSVLRTENVSSRVYSQVTLHEHLVRSG
jgi:hypothetical protein